MLTGLITNSPPASLRSEEGGRWVGSVIYSGLLTARGKMITDLRLYSDPEEGFLLDLPNAGVDGALAHFGKFLPPRLVKVEDVSSELRIISLHGPQVPSLLSKVLDAQGWPSPLEGMSEMAEGEEFVFVGSPGVVVRLVGYGETNTKGWYLLGPASAMDALSDGLEDAGAVPITEPVLETLRVEKGRPLFGKDMDEETIPIEAGIHHRAIDETKGCYTGQEVIVRIRDRGQVNKRLVGILLGDAQVPESGTPLFQPEREREVGWITTAVSSPAFEQTIALGYLRRSVQPGEEVGVGVQDGPPGQVRALSDEGWDLD
jgi:folate-binding protein YgfZ